MSNSVAGGTKALVELLEETRKSSDAELVEACLNGEEKAFDELLRRYKDRVYNVVYRYLGHREDSLDAALEVFVRAYRNLDTYHGHAQVYTWLYSIAANVCRNRLRDRSRKGRNRGLPASRHRRWQGQRRDAGLGERHGGRTRGDCDNRRPIGAGRGGGRAGRQDRGREDRPRDGFGGQRCRGCDRACRCRSR